MRDPAAAVIVGTGDGALGSSSKVAMVDRGLDGVVSENGK
jgi:hypothetical protein